MTEYTRDMMQQASRQGFLYVPSAAQLTIFQYKTEQQRRRLPAIVLTEDERHTEIAVLLTHSALTQSGKVKIAERFIVAMSPFSFCLVNDRRMICSRLTFSAGFDLARWLCLQLGSPPNLVQGRHSERHHDRIEARKRGDGSLVVNAGAAYIPAQMRIAA